LTEMLRNSAAKYFSEIHSWIAPQSVIGDAKRTMYQADINSVLVTSLVLIDNELAPEQTSHCGKGSLLINVVTRASA
jgi:hypothetical protein